MDHYDYLIAGGGCAGLSLAYTLAHSPLSTATMLVVDQLAKDRNDRTWCFWAKPGFPFTDIACQSWSALEVIDPRRARRFDLGDQRYWMVRGIDYYNAVRAQLSAFPNIRFLQARISQITDGEGQALVKAGDQAFTAGWVFDSTFKPGELHPDPLRYHALKQHFKGWEIESAEPAFDPGAVTLFDFRTAQNGAMTFLYILPLSTRRALIEYTLFSAKVLTQKEYAQELERYITQTLGIHQYRLLTEENGVIPMTDQPFTRRAGQRILNIGTKGGLVKASSGYAFKRIQADSRAIVDSLVASGVPFNIPTSPARYRLYDRIMLQLMTRRGGEMASIFMMLFEHNPIDRVFRFLDEEATLMDDLRLMSTLPLAPFTSALVKLELFKKL
jgi:lycopene beta-cyclase